MYGQWDNNNELLQAFLLTGSNVLYITAYPKASTLSYTSPTEESPGSLSQLYLACRRITRGAAKSWEVPFSSRLCHRSTRGYFLPKSHPISSRLSPAWKDRSRSSTGPPSSWCSFSIGVHMQQSLIWCATSLHIRVYEWVTYKKYWFLMVACSPTGGDWANTLANGLETPLLWQD